MRTPVRRSPEKRAADRAEVLRLADGARCIRDIAKASGFHPAEVAADIYALRRQGHAAPTRIVPRNLVDGGCIYRHYDAAGVLLYIGACANPLQRTAGHASQSPWFKRVVRIEVEHIADGYAVLMAERAAIRAEQPLINRQFRAKDVAAVIASEGAP